MLGNIASCVQCRIGHSSLHGDSPTMKTLTGSNQTNKPFKRRRVRSPGNYLKINLSLIGNTKPPTTDGVGRTLNSIRIRGISTLLRAPRYSQGNDHSSMIGVNVVLSSCFTENQGWEVSRYSLDRAWIEAILWLGIGVGDTILGHLPL